MGIRYGKGSKGFINYSQTIDDAYENLGDYKTTKERKLLIVLDDLMVHNTTLLLSHNLLRFRKTLL